MEALVGEIRRSFPPIAGVMHAAMVLQDSPFSEMSVEVFEKVTRPKVLGTIHLDRLFRDGSLDFFIFFSSLASGVGNRGQANYSAANMYMEATALERRRSGLAASVIHLSIVVGVGYVSHQLFKTLSGESFLATFHCAGFGQIDVRALHQCIAEAILAGRPHSGRDPVLVAGVRLLSVDEGEKAGWTENPRFYHCIAWDGGGTKADANRGQGGAAVTVKAALLEATTPEEALGVITDAFLRKLQVMLQTQLESDEDRAGMLAANAEDTGIDSLIAVEIRSWFHKEIGVDVPVLKILGGATVAELIAFALEKLPVALTLNPGETEQAIATATTGSGTETESTAPASASFLGHNDASNDRASTAASDIATPASPSLDIKDTVANADDGGPCSSPPYPRDLDMERTAPMSFGQSRFWFLQHYVEDRATFNIAFSGRLKGLLQVAKLEEAILALGQRHQALRTAFVVPQNLGTGGGGSGSNSGQQLPVQCILKRSLLRLEQREIADASEGPRAARELLNHVFDIERGESMRVILLRLNSTDHFLAMGCHHINMDGESLEVFLADLSALYSGQPLGPPPHQYPDFAVQQRLAWEQGEMDGDIAYWKTQLSGLPAAVPLLPHALVKTRTALRRYDHNRVDRRVDAGLAARFRAMCRAQKASQFHAYLAVLQATLFRLLDVEDVCIGMADANRFEGNIATSMGMYLNLLPLRFRLAGSQKYQDVLRGTRRTVYEAMAHSRVPFDLVLDKLQISRSTLHSPLFQTFISYRAGVSEKRTMGTLEVEGASEEYHFGRTAYDINLNILENPGSDPRLMFYVQKELYSEQEADVFADTFMHLLDSFAQQPASTLDKPSAFTPKSVERAIQLGRGNYSL